jgi:hypothetical protein
LKWISVKDRLPTEGTSCLAFFESGIIDSVYYCQNSRFLLGLEGIESLYSNVTHWMPLPEPPKDTDNIKGDKL